MTDKELVEFIYDKLMIQGRQSVNKFTRTCMYRGPEGTKCAVGWIIPDDRYNTLFEGKTLFKGAAGMSSITVVGEFLLTLGYTEKQLILLERIQRKHDTASGLPFRKHIHEQFTRICREFKIDAKLKGVEHYEMVQ